VLLPEGVIEVRIWEQYEPWSRFLGTIVQKRGTSFHGVELLFGDIEPDFCVGWAVGIEPCASWEVVWSELLAHDLMDLPDSTQLSGERSLEDGAGFIVEIQTLGRYRTYHYSNPGHQTWPEARSIEEIIGVVRRRIRCDQHRTGSEQHTWNRSILVGQRMFNDRAPAVLDE